MNKEYFAYTRVSTVKQGDGVSLEAQREAIERYAQQHGLTVSHWFEEKETAAKQGRPVFTAMIKLLGQGKAQGLVMHKIDRSARNLRDWATVGDLQDSGIEVHFAAESVDFASRGGRLTADIQAVIAADYIRNLKDEIRKGQVGRLKQGLYPFSAPFGYLNQGKGQPKAIDPVRGPRVREMFELYASGQFSLTSLEQEMYDRGLRSTGGRKVYKSKIELILANPFYMGIIKLAGHPQPYNGLHEPIVTPELFQAVQRVKANRARRKRTKHNLLFRGMFSCRSCGNSMIPERQRGHGYYRCHTKSCPSNSIREEALDWAVLKTLAGFQLCPRWAEEFEAALSKSLTGLPEAASANTRQLELAKIDGQIERLTQGYIDGLIPEEVFRRKKEDCEFRKLELSKTAQSEVSQAQRTANARKFLEHAKSLTRTYFFADDSEKRQMLDLCFSNMKVADKHVEIEPRSWLCPLGFGPVVLLGADYGAKNRSRTEMPARENEDDPIAQEGNSSVLDSADYGAKNRSRAEMPAPESEDDPIAQEGNSSVLDSADYGAENRSRTELGPERIVEVIDALNCPEALRAERLLSDINERAQRENLPEPPDTDVYREAA